LEKLLEDVQLPQFVAKQKVRDQSQTQSIEFKTHHLQSRQSLSSFQKIVTDEDVAKPDEEAANADTASDDGNPAALAQELREAIERAKVGLRLDLDSGLTLYYFTSSPLTLLLRSSRRRKDCRLHQRVDQRCLRKMTTATVISTLSRPHRYDGFWCYYSLAIFFILLFDLVFFVGYCPAPPFLPL
jgi:hypothetical protein